ncbi:crotonyl-CoA carboxylase/reductase [uncultured Desulfovibrio sp.]|uniref:crotonyl-CoA carboxylase/reductase n=1 Tax=uncultured Desulfovibrio sp. TaxID=167968 RepID=UPI00261651C0|nr:crotonyl-CoA carboxylase/reductase [uncultured Desulfovibrio sp.]
MYYMTHKENAVASYTIPKTMRAVVIYKAEDEKILRISDDSERLRTAFHIEKNIPTPQPGSEEVLVKVMASGTNFNTIWSLTRKPVSTFDRLSRFAKNDPDAARHNLDYQILGSDAAGVVVKTGSGVRNCKPGDRVVIHGALFEHQSPSTYEDYLTDEQTRIWGYETNFGAFADYCLVRATQILPKPRHLSWAEAAVLTACNGTAYRMLISPKGAQLTLGESVLIWGASGGIGSMAVQYALRAGAVPIAVVSTEAKAELVRRLGCNAVIVRPSEDSDFINPDGTPNMRRLVRFRRQVLEANNGRPPEVVFEHPGRSTFYASLLVAANRGRIVTCGSTTGYDHLYDNRYLWMYGKRIIGCHFASWDESARATDLACRGLVNPLLSAAFPLEGFHDAIEELLTEHVGKVAILCNANTIDEGIEDYELRQAIGEEKLDIFRKRTR